VSPIRPSGDWFQPDRITVAIFAGPSGAPAEEGTNKNFFRLRGRPVVQRQIDVVKDMGFAGLVVVTERRHVAELELPPGTTVIESAARQSENFAAVKASRAWADDERCLVLFGDTPLVTRGAILDFLERCRIAAADIHHGLVPYVFVEPYMDFFPRDHVGRRPFHVREFLARLGGMSLCRVAAYDPERTRHAVRSVMRGRKQDPGRRGFAGILTARARVLWGGLRFVGPAGAWMGLCAIVAHWLHERGFPRPAGAFRRALTLEGLDDVGTRLMGCPLRLVPCPFGTTSLDIDNDVDLSVHEQYLDHLQALMAIEERIMRKLVEPGFEMTWEALAMLDRFDPELASELRRHPEIYLEQQRILRANPLPAKAREAA
jgi:hypothetical protein